MEGIAKDVCGASDKGKVAAFTRTKNAWVTNQVSDYMYSVSVICRSDKPGLLEHIKVPTAG